MNLVGILLGLFSALNEASLNTVVNSYKAKYSAILMGFAQLLLLLPFTVAALFFIELPAFSWSLFLYLGIFALLNVLGRVLYIKSIHLSGLAKTVPFLSFTPIFLIFVGLVVLGEVPSVFGLAGILLIVIGAYVISCNKVGESLIQVLKNIGREKGTLLIILTAFIWSLTSSFGKKAVLLSSSPFFFVMAINLQFILFFFLNWRATGLKETVYHIKNDIRFFLLVSLFLGLMEISIFTAYGLTKITYAISMKRTAILFSVIFGYIFFKEKGIKKNIVAALIMISGVILIVMLGK